MQEFVKRLQKNGTLLALGMVTILAYCTYVHGYHQPAELFWDENYHIASAQKYIHQVHFMEPHPPLGKLLIAAGEVLLQPEGNGASDQFIGTDYGRYIPDDFSFAGYRLFPTLLAWAVAPLLFGIFYLLTGSNLFALLLSLLYVFENANIVHSRSAMLESTLLFFCCSMILLWLLLRRQTEDGRSLRLQSVLMGAAFGGAVTTKVNGLIMILLILALIVEYWPRTQLIAKTVLFQVIGFAIVFVSVWHVHFMLGSNIQHSLPDGGYYQASAEYKEILADGTNRALWNFPVMLRDSMKFLPHYQRGVPKLDLCKSGENGSPYFLWPFGGRSINYRWETPGGDDAPYRYLYLQVNPVAWWLGLLGVVLAAALLLAHLLLPLQKPLKQPYLLTVFLGMYASYMITMSQVTRVMYLYHYFIPLIFSFILFGLCIVEIRKFWTWNITTKQRTHILLACSVLIFGGYQTYRPLTYYEPIKDAQVQKRNILKVWDLRCVKCDTQNGYTRKSCK